MVHPPSATGLLLATGMIDALTSRLTRCIVSSFSAVSSTVVVSAGSDLQSAGYRKQKRTCWNGDSVGDASAIGMATLVSINDRPCAGASAMSRAIEESEIAEALRAMTQPPQ